ncbi:helix-turn-helix transcriptional regulator [Paraglaciecola aquimarina]|uniref:Helix-turn-helix transcriptional regulator n=1 Tax=Paraglaciecola aquimarina TaxID=1235557 RepID=A0ABU3SR87_9ALTE|nr:helix-turn-helix transcriptional regulator [Paraglaciecola aquimarina]MDU0352519.1 helix-turn-helix transcriptional regulator [Paraglaciecola aquimarina]
MSRVSIGSQLQTNRTARHLTQTDIAKKLNCDRAAISRIENGKYQGSLQLLERYLNLLGLELFAAPIKPERPTLDNMDGIYDD